MAKYKFKPKKEQMNAYHVKELVVLLIKLLEKKHSLKVDDEIVEMSNSIKIHFEEII